MQAVSAVWLVVSAKETPAASKIKFKISYVGFFKI